MSYILDALKKLEQRKQHEGTPNLLTSQSELRTSPGKRSLWPYFVSGIVLFVAGVMSTLFLIQPWGKTPPPQPIQSWSAEEPATPRPLTNLPAVRSDMATGTQSKPQASGTGPAAGQIARPAATTPPLASDEKRADGASSKQPSFSEKTNLNASSEESRPAIKQSHTVVGIAQLPPEIRSKLPELKMTVHSYTEQPQGRFVVINNSTAREGQSVGQELIVERITPSGVVINYHGHRFSIGIHEGP